MNRSSSAKSRVPGEERVFSLILALVASPQGLSRNALLSSVYGYADRYDSSESSVAIDRQFERDKEQVRAMGIPIETIDAPGEPGNTQLTRYRISKDQLQLPPEVRFSAEELTILRLASLAWRDGSLSSESRWASMKLASLGSNLDIRHIGVAPRVGMIEPGASALQRAIDERKIVRFDYQLPERNQPLNRTVAPLRLHRAEGRWHLLAHDLDRAESRVFLLSRIVSDVHIEAQTFDERLLDGTDQLLKDLLSRFTQQVVVVDVQKGSAAEARLSHRGVVTVFEQESRIALGTLDLDALASELAGFGDEVRVHSPEQLRSLTISLLQKIDIQHMNGGHNA